MLVYLTLTSEQAYTCCELLSAEIDRLSEIECWSKQMSASIANLERLLTTIEAAIARTDDGKQTLPI